MRATRVATILLALILSACAPQVSRRTDIERQAPPPAFADRYYEQAAKLGKQVFEIERVRSLVVIEVRRGGSLAHLGHDHVVASHGVHGYLAPQEGRADLYIRLDELVVDEPDLRAAAGFDTRPSSADVAGTRENMLSKVLHVEEHPFAVISLPGVGTDDKAAELRTSLTLNGVTRMAKIQAVIEAGNDEIRVAGQTVIVQSDFGIVPFSILGGAIQVQDPVTVRFEIHARQIAL